MSQDCGTHAGAADELRALALTALDRLDPMLDRLRAGEPSPQADAPCSGCPVCALLAVVRGEHPELAARLAEHASGLLAVLRAALDEGGGSAPGAGPPSAGPAPSRPRVQKIPVEKSPVADVTVQNISVVRP